MINWQLLIDKNTAFSEFNVKEGDFLLENDAALRVKTGIIYIIVNLVNGKVYVGLSRQTFRNRYEGNWASFSGNKHLKKAALKYGKENFAILIIEEKRGLNILNILETYYILKFRSNESKYGYNKTSGGDNHYRFSKDIIDKATYTKEEFINLARKKHQNKYNYDSLVYIRSKFKVKIFCNICQDFFYQTPSSHLAGKGCRKCGLKNMGERNLISFEEFQERSNKRFGEEYIFFKESYVSFQKPVTGKHNKCGAEFCKTPLELLRQKMPCPKCQKIKSINNAKQLRKKVSNKNISIGILNKSYLSYSKKIKTIHGDKFSCLGYTTKLISNGWNKIIIKQKCNNCGYEFLREKRYINKGCPNCCDKKIERNTHA